MNYGEYHGQTLTKMQTKRWRTTVNIDNGYGTITAGTEVKIEGKRMGLVISTDPCASCGVSLRVSHVRYSEVEEIPT